ncbi:polysaccharide pyruvyl transferase family protein [Synechocystis sp. PCC 7509]|uniref:polysaccharide pyruvyl transferase family protein n=1 Tax=Synechocystis sp. PCC 7509 TaxID=927677 RepID=UPI0002AC8696|nr:polysaccharide pyruvyl transferase family protein [Synechocystis sp. PCC 7509]
MKICLFDPGIENHTGKPSSNLGDLIIQEAVNREINNIFPNSNIIRYSTQQFLEKSHVTDIVSCPLILVGGTNLLSSHILKYQQWKLSLIDAIRIKNVVLLGVGWWQYQKSPDLYTKFFLTSVLNKNKFHSVRDDYTKSMLETAGIRNVINTGCPTMWGLTDMKSDDIPTTKADNALLMLTDYSKNIDLDKKLIQLLINNYQKVYAWPQGRSDKEYLSNLGFSGIFLDHSLPALDEFLNSKISFDYIGTRLHGGIRCIMNKRRSLILEIDNRAKEIAKNTGLPTINRADFDYIKNWIIQGSITKINIDPFPIKQWKQQFLVN